MNETVYDLIQRRLQEVRAQGREVDEAIDSLETQIAQRKDYRAKLTREQVALESALPETTPSRF